MTRFLELRDILRIFLFLQTLYVVYDSKTVLKVSRRILETQLRIKSVTMFEKYKDKFSASGHVSMGEPRHRFSQLPQFGEIGDDEMADEFRTVSRRKRQRRSIIPRSLRKLWSTFLNVNLRPCPRMIS